MFYGGYGYGGFGFGALWLVLLFLGIGFAGRRRFGYGGYGGYGGNRCCNQVTYVNCGSRRRCYRKKRRCGCRY